MPADARDFFLSRRGAFRKMRTVPMSADRRSIVAACLLAVACSDPDAARLKATTKATYNPKTGRLTELTYDRNKNGVIDTWTDMDGTKPLRSRIDFDEDGKIDRWEYYDGSGHLAKVGFSRGNTGKPDAWAYARADGRVDRIEISSTADEKRIDRWEHYDPSTAGAGPQGAGALLAAEEDTNGDGKPDKWEKYEGGTLISVEFDENGDGKPDRRLTYRQGALATIESAPDGAGRYSKRIDVR
jgi:hypothetical protein